VGDIIEFSYSIQALNTVERSHGTFVLKRGSTSKAAKWRLLYAPERQVFALPLNHEIQPTVAYTDTGLVDCRWEVLDQKPVLVEADMPSWYLPWSLVEYGEFSSWNEVAQWACRLFYAPSELPPEFAELVAGIASASTSFPERVQQALRFVQDDIRYVSISVGEHGYKPYDVATILERRYGDCKDKASLLSSLLRHLGIDALPVLVNTHRRHEIAHHLPSPSAFNHAIVKILHENQTYWIDATMRGQRGKLDDIYCPEYGKALVISPDTLDLENVTPRGTRGSILKIVESFKIHQVNSPAEFSVHRIYQGAAADAMRNRIANSNHDQIEREFLNKYLVLYPRISVAHAWSHQDDPAANRLQVTFDYRIADLWKPVQRQPGFVIGEFYATGIHHVLRSPAVSARRTPYAIAHPNNIENELIIRTTRPLRFARGHEIVECDAFRYKSQRQAISNAVQFNMQFTSHKDHVMPREMDKYLQAIRLVASHIRQTITLQGQSHQQLRTGVHGQPRR